VAYLRRNGRSVGSQLADEVERGEHAVLASE
jgi:hypothetical protein